MATTLAVLHGDLLRQYLDLEFRTLLLPFGFSIDKVCHAMLCSMLGAAFSYSYSYRSREVVLQKKELNRLLLDYRLIADYHLITA